MRLYSLLSSDGEITSRRSRLRRYTPEKLVRRSHRVARQVSWGVAAQARAPAGYLPITFRIANSTFNNSQCRFADGHGFLACPSPSWRSRSIAVLDAVARWLDLHTPRRCSFLSHAVPLWLWHGCMASVAGVHKWTLPWTYCMVQWPRLAHLVHVFRACPTVRVFRVRPCTWHGAVLACHGWRACSACLSRAWRLAQACRRG